MARSPSASRPERRSPDRRGALARRLRSALAGVGAAALLAACASLPPPEATAPPPAEPAAAPEAPADTYFALPDPDQAREVVVFALGLLGTGYRFGGSNPEAGLDCSGMVSYIVAQVSGQHLPHNAARIAAITRPIERDALEPGDLVFFNTAHRSHSHVGIYLGEGRFVHAPSSRGRVRIERLDLPYFATRFDGARTLVAID